MLTAHTSGDSLVLAERIDFIGLFPQAAWVDLLWLQMCVWLSSEIRKPFSVRYELLMSIFCLDQYASLKSKDLCPSWRFLEAQSQLSAGHVGMQRVFDSCLEA